MELRLGEGGAAYEERVGPLAHKSLEGHCSPMARAACPYLSAEPPLTGDNKKQ
jgi:hypothetical protein